MPLGRAPKRMFGSAARSERACGHSPPFSFGAGAVWAAAPDGAGCGRPGRLSAVAEEASAKAARAAAIVEREIVIIGPLETRALGAAEHAGRRRPVQGAIGGHADTSAFRAPRLVLSVSVGKRVGNSTEMQALQRY